MYHNLYEVGERDIIGQGNHYGKHVVAMTREALHSKSDIAAELAHRDIEIERLEYQKDVMVDLLYSCSSYYQNNKDLAPSWMEEIQDVLDSLY